MEGSTHINKPGSLRQRAVLQSHVLRLNVVAAAICIRLHTGGKSHTGLSVVVWGECEWRGSVLLTGL